MIPADAMAEIDKITGYRFRTSWLTNLRLPPTGAIVKRRNRYHMELQPGSDSSFGVFVCSMTWLCQSGPQTQHELRTRWWQVCVRMLARLMV